MTTREPRPISITKAVAALTFLPDRTPTTTDDEAGHAFTMLSTYREGAVFVGHWAGASEWERHSSGEEIVMVLDGETTIYFLTAEDESASDLEAGELVIVPQGTWHRFEAPKGVKLLSVTPLPTDHRSSRPEHAAHHLRVALELADE